MKKMTDFELLLFDRIEKIKQMNEQYDLENNAYISFSGGKDSTILHYLLDMALPNNKIPRLFINTGVEYKYIREFVQELAQTDERIIIYNSGVNIKLMLETEGYPFKSKQHSHNWSVFNNHRELVQPYIDKFTNNPELLKDFGTIHNLPRNVKTTIKYVFGIRENADNVLYSFHDCPKKLKYQFSNEKMDFKLSDQCCYRLKKEPAKRWENQNNRFIAITGIRADEGGMRSQNGCAIFEGNNLKKFHPLKVISDDFEAWFIDKYQIKLCKLYYPPYNFERTGCKGCPFALELQEQLDIMELLLPNEYKQCETIWKPAYDEYRRIGYRLRKKGKPKQMSLDDYL